jgi:hypothetical protein
MLKDYPLLHHASAKKETVFLGAPSIRHLQGFEKDVLLCFNIDHIEQAEFYSRVIINSRVYTTESYCTNIKTNSCYVLLTDGNFASILSFVSIQGFQSAIAILLRFNVERRNNHMKCMPNHYKLLKATDSIFAVRCEQIYQKCVSLGKLNECDDGLLIALQPNTCEVD